MRSDYEIPHIYVSQINYKDRLSSQQLDMLVTYNFLYHVDIPQRHKTLRTPLYFFTF